MPTSTAARALALVLPLALVVALGLAPRPALAEGGQKVTAATLVKDMDHALSFVAKAAKAAGAKLAPKNLKAKPFWLALKEMDKETEGLAAALKAHDKAYFAALAKAGEALARLKVAAKHAGATKDAKVKEGVETLARAYDALRSRTGLEAARRKQGGELTEKEAVRLAQAKAAAAALAKKLEALRAKAAAKKDARVVAQMEHLLVELARVADAPATVEGYLLEARIVDVVEGEWIAYEYTLEGEWRHEFAEMHATETFEAWDAEYVAEAEEVEVDVEHLAEAEVEIPADDDVTVEMSDEESQAEDADFDEVADESPEDFQGEEDHAEHDEADDHEDPADEDGE